MINKHNLNLPRDKSCHAINDKQLHFMLEKWNLDLLQAGKKNKTYKLGRSYPHLVNSSIWSKAERQKDNTLLDISDNIGRTKR